MIKVELTDKEARLAYLMFKKTIAKKGVGSFNKNDTNREVENLAKEFDVDGRDVRSLFKRVILELVEETL